MAADEEFAKQLQLQFEEEAKAAQSLLLKDEQFAHKVAAHQLSDSDDDDIGRSTLVLERDSCASVIDDLNKKTGKQSSLPPCRFGDACYRTNPLHFQQFSHSLGKSNTISQVKENCARLSGKNTAATLSNRGCSKEQIRAEEPPSKKSRIERKPEKKSFSTRLMDSEPFRIFFNKCFSLNETHTDHLGLVFPDLLNPRLGNIIETLQINFMVEVEFLYENYKAAGIDEKPLLLLYGELDGDAKLFPGGNFVKVPIPFPYGTHHSKVMVIRYDSGLRVVVHTANLRSDDWNEKTQGFWVSPVFPKLDSELSGRSSLSGDSITFFKKDFLEYLTGYKLKCLETWCKVVSEHDFKQCNAVFVGHVPGYHSGASLHQFGQQKLKKILREHSEGSKWRSTDALQQCMSVMQCSSIGSLGKDSTWLCQELGAALSGGQRCPSSKAALIYPSEERVRTSSQGWCGGSCLPYQSSTHSKQLWIMRHLHEWCAEGRNRSKAMPHIKTYTRVLVPDSSSTLVSSSSSTEFLETVEAQYLLITSANLSKAAWGQLQKHESQLFIRSYEAGVLLLPKFLTGLNSFPLSGPKSLPLVYDFPLNRYSSEDMPWLMDTDKNKEDIYGHTYP